MLRISTLALCFALVSCGFNKNVEVQNNNLKGIVGGTDVSEKDPLAASIVGIYDREYNGSCTGTIISNEYILTAAHCAPKKASDLVIMFGVNMDELLGAREQDIIEMYTRQAVAFKAHEKYNEKDEEIQFDTHDIAIIKFKGGLPEGYRPAKILANDEFLRRGMVVTLAGYGVSSVVTDEIDAKKVKKLEEKIESGEIICDDDNTNCISVEMSGDGLLRKTQVPISSLHETEFRTKENEGHASCAGDSGGPVFIEKDGETYLLGVTSRGDALCDTSGVYTNVVYFGKWIQDTVKALSLVKSGRR